MIVVVANSLSRASARKLTYPLFLDAIFMDGYKLLLVIASVPRLRCFMASFKENSTLSIACRLWIKVSLLHKMKNFSLVLSFCMIEIAPFMSRIIVPTPFGVDLLSDTSTCQ